MSLHTTSNGSTHDVRIRRDLWDIHWPELGPPQKLIGDYYKRGLVWKDFEWEYILHLRSSEDAQNRLYQLINIADRTDVSILCIEDAPRQCHRRLLIEEIKLIAPDLAIGQVL